jgi:D-alanine-D-alanine ligase
LGVIENLSIEKPSIESSTLLRPHPTFVEPKLHCDPRLSLNVRHVITFSLYIRMNPPREHQENPQVKKVGLIVGGMGSEREVSLKTGAAFLKALQKLNYPHEVIDAGADLPSVLKTKNIDCALLALHGKYGEDGTVQGILEYLKIPYTGSGVLASALAMNKIATKQILTHWGVPTPEFQIFDCSNLDQVDLTLNFGVPLVVKPANEGSTVGISIVHKADGFKKALKEAAKCDRHILVEKYIDGAEVTVPIWFGKVLPIIEIVPKSDFYDYKRKYTPGQTEYIIPARISHEVYRKCEQYSLETFKAVGCRHYARVDLRIDKNDNPYVLEINTLPGCTETSLFPKAAAQVGMSFEMIIKTLVEEATLDYS